MWNACDAVLKLFSPVPNMDVQIQADMLKICSYIGGILLWLIYAKINSVLFIR